MLIVPALAGLVTAALIQGYFVSGGGEIRGHVPGSDLDQMSAAQPVATLVYATAADAATRITVTSTIATAPSLR